MTHARNHLGQHGEDYVAQALQRAGYTILARNWHRAQGELDIIAQSPPGTSTEIVFVEVRTRRGPLDAAVEAALESVNGPKQARLLALAEAYLVENELENAIWRIDVAAVGWQNGAHKMEVITNAVMW